MAAADVQRLAGDAIANCSAQAAAGPDDRLHGTSLAELQDFGHVAARLNALPNSRLIELLEVVGPLTDPPRTGVAPGTGSTSCRRPCPATAFSDEPTEVGWDPGRTAQAWAELMNRPGYSRLRRPGRRPGRFRHRGDGSPRAGWTAVYSPHPAHGLPDRRGGRPLRRTDTGGALRACCDRRPRSPGREEGSCD